MAKSMADILAEMKLERSSQPLNENTTTEVTETETDVEQETIEYGGIPTELDELDEMVNDILEGSPINSDHANVTEKYTQTASIADMSKPELPANPKAAERKAATKFSNFRKKNKDAKAKQTETSGGGKKMGEDNELETDAYIENLLDGNVESTPEIFTETEIPEAEMEAPVETTTEATEDALDTSVIDDVMAELGGEATPEPSFEAETEFETFDNDDEFGVSEDIIALSNGEDLPVEFQEKLKTIFENSVRRKTSAWVEKYKVSLREEMEEELAIEKEKLSSQVNDYMTYVAEEWMAENSVAVEKGLRAELSEEIIADLKAVFENHNIELPDEKVNMLDALMDEKEELERRLDEQIANNVELSKQVNNNAKGDITSEYTDGLTDTDVERFMKVAESSEFTNEEDYRGKLDILAESYGFTNRKQSNKVLNENFEVTEGDVTENLTEENKSNKKSVFPEVNAARLAASIAGRTLSS